MFADLLIKSGHHWQKFHLKYRPKKKLPHSKPKIKRKREKKENATNKISGVHMRVYLKMCLICTHETWHELKEEKKENNTKEYAACTK